jgi:hypothetical protein
MNWAADHIWWWVIALILSLVCFVVDLFYEPPGAIGFTPRHSKLFPLAVLLIHISVMGFFLTFLRWIIQH